VPLVNLLPFLRSTDKSFFLRLASDVLGRGVTFLFLLILARRVSVEDFGRLGFAFSCEIFL